MSKFRFQHASARQLENWDDYVRHSVNGTLFHRRDFLRYHGNRFGNAERFVVLLNGDSVQGQISYAPRETQDCKTIAVSPYGASYGGVVFEKVPTYESSREIVGALNDFVRREGLDGISLTQPITCCSSASMDVFVFALLEQGYKSVSRNISSVFDLSSGTIESQVDARARNMMRNAQKAGVTLTHRERSKIIL